MNAKSHFFCDICGKEVAAHLDACPHCGVNFAGVRCPACQFHGEVTAFAKGCPACGYSMSHSKGKAPKPQEAKPTKKSKPAGGHFRYPWQFHTKDLSIVALTLAITTLVFMLLYYLRR